MHPTLLRLVIVVMALFVFPTLSTGQPGGDRAIVLDSAPIVLLPDPNRTPLRVATKGTLLIVLKDEGDWLQVQFQDPQFGTRTGYVQRRYVRVERPAPRPVEAPVVPTAPRPEPQVAAPAPPVAASPAPTSPTPVAVAPSMPPQAPPVPAPVVSNRPSGPRLTDQQVIDAIRAGEQNKFDKLAAGCNAGPGFGEGLGAAIAGGVQRDGTFTVAVSGSAGFIASLAMNAKRLYQPLTLERVNPELREPKLLVVVIPDNPSRSRSTISVASPIQHVVLRSRSNNNIVVQPIQVLTEAVSWSNLAGGAVEANKATAYFDPGSMRELPAGDVEVIVITAHGERRCRIGRGDRERVFGR